MRPIPALLVFLLSGCANYAARIQEPRMRLELGEYDAAINLLKPLADQESNDQLLFLMDLGVCYFRAHKYPEAIETFLKADKLAALKDYTSVTQEAGSVILNDNVKVYQGEDFEKILINVYLSMSYALSNRWEDALVEARRVNHKLDLMNKADHLPYEKNAFAKYLAGLMFEAKGELNDAFVDYRQLLKWRNDAPPQYLDIGLLRMADKLKAEQEFEEFKKRFPNTKNYKLQKNQGEIVLLLEQGRAPIKLPSPVFPLVPQMVRQYYRSDYAWLREKAGAFKAKTVPYYDIEFTAIKELSDRITAITAKKIAGVVVKEIIADQVERQTDNKLLGFLTRLFLRATDQADLRSWTTLPARLHFARVAVPAGRHDIVLDMVSQTGEETRAVTQWTGVEVKAGQFVFLSYRTQD